MNKSGCLSLKLLLAITLLTSSCSSTTPEERPDDIELYSLEPGNYWNYQSTFLSSFTDTFSVEIVSSFELETDGNSYLTFGQITSTNGVVNESTPTWLYSHGPEGLYAMGILNDRDTLVVRSLYRKASSEIGETWLTERYRFNFETDDFNIVDPLEVSLIAVGEPFQTLTGTFNTTVYQYEFRPADDVAEIWVVKEYYAPNVGLVGQVTTGKSFNGQLTNEKRRLVLYDYHIGG